ncbi:hypothetical protein V1517DRAFT_317300 [Lipomyces orientalis]|uniref:Uncharacterized protein n=1 Tax=Lipomyces orientalis TaxID=1233043 RepID=A0ACC3TU23_9ASCO
MAQVRPAVALSAASSMCRLFDRFILDIDQVGCGYGSVSMLRGPVWKHSHYCRPSLLYSGLTPSVSGRDVCRRFNSPMASPDPPGRDDDNTDVLLPDVSAADFAALDLRVGTITDCALNPKARKPAYKLEIDFGPKIGTRTSSAQITHYYGADDLVGRQVVAAVNLGMRRIAGVKSQALVLGADGNGDGTITLLAVERPVPNGTRIS